MKIDNCRSCHSENLKLILSLGEQYLSHFVDNDDKPHKFPLELVYCQNCQLVQLLHTTPPSLLYGSDYGYRSGINQTMQDELRDIVYESMEFITLKNDDIVVDIGSNDATLLNLFPQIGFKVGFDPVSKFREYYNGIHFINNYFNYMDYYENFSNQKAKIITAIAMFYDLDDPNTFLDNIKMILDPDGIFIIQQNYLLGMLEQTAFDNIVHEHLEYYSLTSLNNLLKKYDLEVFKVEQRLINGGSFRTYIALKGKKNVDQSVRLMLENEKQLDNTNIYRLFANDVARVKKELMDFLKGKKVYIYGASTRGNTLLQYCGIDSKICPFAVERNPEKWGKKIASVGIPIISEEQARKDRPDYMLVLPWFFFYNEILEREKEYLINGGKFIIPLPEFHIVIYENGKFYRVLSSTSRKEEIT